MPCENCTHTLQSLASNAANFGPMVFWCNRCGTIRTAGGVPESESPMIVERLRTLASLAAIASNNLTEGSEVIISPGSPMAKQLRMALRAAEECLKPEERRTK